MIQLDKPNRASGGVANRCRSAKVLVYLGLCWACNSSPRGTVPSASPSASTGSARQAQTQTQTRPQPSASARPRPTEYCRAIKVTGEVLADGGQALKRGDEVDGKRWLSLRQGASVVIRHAASAREYALSGPARARPCHQGEEEVLLVEGEFKATSGSGVRPGAFVTVATPWGTLRYGNAEASIRATSQAAEVSVNTGTVWVDAAQGVKLIGEPKLAGPKAKAKLAATATYSRGALVKACEADAKAAEDKAESLLGGRGQAGFGAEAALHMRLRGAARRSCQVAQATLGLALEPTEAAALEKRVASANQRWQRVPMRVTQKRQQ